VQQLGGIVEYDVLSLQLTEPLLDCESHITPWHFIPPSAFDLFISLAVLSAAVMHLISSLERLAVRVFS
jgi:hypothetical protein